MIPNIMLTWYLLAVMDKWQAKTHPILGKWFSREVGMTRQVSRRVSQSPIHGWRLFGEAGMTRRMKKSSIWCVVDWLKKGSTEVTYFFQFLGLFLRLGISDSDSTYEFWQTFVLFFMTVLSQVHFVELNWTKVKRLRFNNPFPSPENV